MKRRRKKQTQEDASSSSSRVRYGGRRSKRKTRLGKRRGILGLLLTSFFLALFHTT